MFKCSLDFTGTVTVQTTMSSSEVLCRADHNQASPMYKAAGSQCASNVCLSFIMELATQPIPSWESLDMNTILREGDNLHIDLQKEYTSTEYFMIDELPNAVTIPQSMEKESSGRVLFEIGLPTGGIISQNNIDHLTEHCKRSCAYVSNNW